MWHHGLNNGPSMPEPRNHHSDAPRGSHSVGCWKPFLCTCRDWLHTFSQHQNHEVMLVAWTGPGGNMYMTEISKLQIRLSPLWDQFLNIYPHTSAFTVETVAQSMILRPITSEFHREKRRGRVKVWLFKIQISWPTCTNWIRFSGGGAWGNVFLATCKDD